MIFEALKIIRDELGHYMELHPESNLSAEDVVLDNVASLEGNSRPELQGRLLISLVNVEEEGALKNAPFIQRSPGGGIRYENAPVNLNLYLLFCANLSSDMEAYQFALRQLSLVIQFFQGKNLFLVSQAPHSTVSIDPDNPDLTELRVILDLYTLTFEQINHLWGALGGRQIPFVMYKARLVAIRDRRPLGSGEVVKEIQSSEDIY
ncbi:MAG: DUF4255 domain-containing protein [Phaeodactylibacter sp.]|nr:DUF4255 domain-containing protein [Phaeodactylibacter sp.]MCB9301667.1 DUF4255 domain-containing protein [Lewinellaceae bacterium]